MDKNFAKSSEILVKLSFLRKSKSHFRPNPTVLYNEYLTRLGRMTGPLVGNPEDPGACIIIVLLHFRAPTFVVAFVTVIWIHSTGTWYQCFMFSSFIYNSSKYCEWYCARLLITGTNSVQVFISLIPLNDIKHYRYSCKNTGISQFYYE